MDKLEELEKRIEVVESLVKTNKENGTKNFIHNYTINPKEMPEGYVAYVGKYDSGSIGSTFGANKSSIRDSLGQDSIEMANTLNAFASPERINIIKLLMQHPMTARSLMEKLQFKTTGKLYHHLSFLEKIGMLRKENEEFHIVGPYISCIVLIFTAVAKIIRQTPAE